MDLTQFWSEQTAMLDKAAALVDHGEIPLTTGLLFTIGVRHTPLVAFLLAIPMLISKDPVWISGFQAGLDVVAIGFVFLIGRSFGGLRCGFAAALLYAVSPAAVNYSRLIWAPDYLPFLGAVAMWGTVSFVRGGDHRRLAIAVFVACLGTELHPSAAVLLLVPAVAAARRRQDLRWRPFAIALAAFSLLTAPYVVLQMTTAWSDIPAFQAYLARPNVFSWQGPYIALAVVGGDFQRQITSQFRAPDPTLATEPLMWVMAGLVLIGSEVALRRNGGWVVVGSLVLPVLATVRFSATLYPHYLLPILPPMACLAAIGLTRIRPRALSLIVVAAVAAVAAVRFQQIVSFDNAVAELELGPQYSVPLRYTAEAARLGLQLDGPPRLFVGTDGANGGYFLI
ncbi:MAG: hypothetical protein EXR58_03515 [Chloroflexi bacterium]|nr:hypothetical protein [Chloroflexota bacterium]